MLSTCIAAEVLLPPGLDALGLCAQMGGELARVVSAKPVKEREGKADLMHEAGLDARRSREAVGLHNAFDDPLCVANVVRGVGEAEDTPVHLAGFMVRHIRGGIADNVRCTARAPSPLAQPCAKAASTNGLRRTGAVHGSSPVLSLPEARHVWHTKRREGRTLGP
eukprot:11228342-Lingulodinium_polyedra.AAC.2